MRRFKAVYFDGCSAIPHPVDIALSDIGLKLTGDGVSLPGSWSYDSIVPAERLTPGRNTVLHCREDADAVLQVEDTDFAAALLAAAPDLRAAHLKDAASLYRPSWWLVAMPLLIMVLLIALGPELLVRAYPDGAKSRLGRIAVSAMVNEAPVCGGHAGMTALEGLVGRIYGDEPHMPNVTISVIDDDSINAFAAPGGHLILMRGLIDVLENPRELSFVLGHELSHLEHEDALRAMVRQRGVTAMLRALGGGAHAVTDVAGSLLNMAHGRRVEERADKDALAMLKRAGILPGSMDGLFERLSRDNPENEGPEFIRTHPVSTNRQKLLQSMLDSQLAQGGGEPAPVLDDGAWQAVKDVCGNRR